MPNTTNLLLVIPAAFLTACSSAQPPAQTLPLASKMVRHASATEMVLYQFGSRQPDGAYPSAGLTNVNGTMYGVTTASTANGPGVLFSITPSGTYTIVHRFNKAQAKRPLRELTAVGRNQVALYGAAYGGGAYGYGTVFERMAGGKIVVLHSFPAPFPTTTDGAWPSSRLLNVGGTLYGTTLGGGPSDFGTVFSITTSGSENVVYNFAGAPNDGTGPEAGMVDVNGTFYGTTSAGGTANSGTVFKVTSSGTESVLHSFSGGSSDGSDPEAPLLNVAGTLYGTTFTGGIGCTPLGGCGTVFQITPSGQEIVLHEFGGSSNDGTNPLSGLLDVNGTLYGTTYGGGANGYGTVFAITRSGTETVVYNFAGGADGAHPEAGLINVGVTLYGTTDAGGGPGFGTIYSLSL
ncbi:MAG: choice-of-anchor tandem repeat GloVer-containing protein [Candidatus Cybelea sp.]